MGRCVQTGRRARDRLDPYDSNLFLSKVGGAHPQDPNKLSSEECAMELCDTGKTAHISQNPEW